MNRFSARRSRDYPLATIAAYGPDTTRATKLVATVLAGADSAPVAMEKWMSDDVDVRNDSVIASKLHGFLTDHDIKQTITEDRIIGCPHEEGIDYPMGRTCPTCPFWAGIDRFTSEPIALPTPSMSPAGVLEALSRTWTTPPLRALESADSHRAALVGPLIAAVDRTIANEASDQEANLSCYALYLLARWRESRAYRSAIRWLSLPDGEPFGMAGDVVTEAGGRILASVCDGDLDPIKSLILNRAADAYGRSAGIEALALLAAWLEVPREPVVEYFQWLAVAGLDRVPDQVWNTLVSEAIAIEASPLYDDLRRAFEDGLVEPDYISRDEFDQAIAGALPGETLRDTRENRPPIGDVAAEIAWWAEFAAPKVGRNDPCPCGSGRKFKRCCGK